MKRMMSFTFAALLAASAPVLGFDTAGLPVTAGGHAHAELRHADRKDGKLTVELRFLTDYEGYSGEKLYDTPADIHVEAAGISYPLAKDPSGKVEAPEKLELKFNYDPARNPRVGSWKGVFDAPPQDVSEAVLVMPNVAPITLTIKDK